MCRSAKSAPGIPAAVDHVIERCLSKNPADRYSSAADLGLALADMAQPSEEILERLMAFGTSVPRLATFSSNPPRIDNVADVVEVDFVRNNSLDPYTTSLKHLRKSRRVSPAALAACGGVLVRPARGGELD